MDKKDKIQNYIWPKIGFISITSTGNPWMPESLAFVLFYNLKTQTK